MSRYPKLSVSEWKSAEPLRGQQRLNETQENYLHLVGKVQQSTQQQLEESYRAYVDGLGEAVRNNPLRRIALPSI
jgi:hypothetical protein